MIFGLWADFPIVSRAVLVLGLSRREWWSKDAEILMLRHQLAVAERERVPCQNPHVALTCWSTLGVRAHSPHLPLHGPGVRLAGTGALRRRSQRTSLDWERMDRLADRWQPQARIMDPLAEHATVIAPAGHAAPAAVSPNAIMGRGRPATRSLGGRPDEPAYVTGASPGRRADASCWRAVSARLWPSGRLACWPCPSRPPYRRGLQRDCPISYALRRGPSRTDQHR